MGPSIQTVKLIDVGNRRVRVFFNEGNVTIEKLNMYYMVPAGLVDDDILLHSYSGQTSLWDLREYWPRRTLMYGVGSNVV